MPSKVLLRDPYQRLSIAYMCARADRGIGEEALRMIDLSLDFEVTLLLGAARLALSCHNTMFSVWNEGTLQKDI